MQIVEDHIDVIDEGKCPICDGEVDLVLDQKHKSDGIVLCTNEYYTHYFGHGQLILAHKQSENIQSLLNAIQIPEGLLRRKSQKAA